MSATTAFDPNAPYDGPVAFGEDGFHYGVVETPVSTEFVTRTADGQAIKTERFDHIIHQRVVKLVQIVDGDGVPQADADGKALYRVAIDSDVPHNDAHGTGVAEVAVL